MEPRTDSPLDVSEIDRKSRRRARRTKTGVALAEAFAVDRFKNAGSERFIAPTLNFGKGKG